MLQSFRGSRRGPRLAADSRVETGFARHLPNFLTALRLVLVPFIVLAILNSRHFVGGFAFCGCRLHRCSGRRAARRLGVTSQTGAYLDPIADKCLLSGVLSALAAAGWCPVWFVAHRFRTGSADPSGGRRGSCFFTGSGVSASIWGKASTFVQIVTAVAWMARNVIELRVLDALSARNAMGLRRFYDLERPALYLAWYSNCHERIDGPRARE